MTMWDNLKKTEDDTMVRFHNKRRGGDNMIELTFARLLNLAKCAKAGGHSRLERREMLAWVIQANSKIKAHTPNIECQYAVSHEDYDWCNLSDNPCFKDTGECDEYNEQHAGS